MGRSPLPLPLPTALHCRPFSHTDHSSLSAALHCQLPYIGRFPSMLANRCCQLPPDAVSTSQSLSITSNLSTAALQYWLPYAISGTLLLSSLSHHQLLSTGVSSLTELVAATTTSPSVALAVIVNSCDSHDQDYLRLRSPCKPPCLEPLCSPLWLLRTSPCSLP